MALQQVYLIDDEVIHNAALKSLIHKLFPNVQVNVFSEPFEGYLYLEQQYFPHPISAILLLNLRMPLLDGWQLLDKLKEYSAAIPDKLKIYILTASVDPEDEVRAMMHPLISGYFRKPISIELFLKVLGWQPEID